MFTRTQLKLTFFYSTFFLMLFWLFSFGLYLWMDNSFENGYISQVRERQSDALDDSDFDDNKTVIVTIAGDVALDQLRDNLIFLNLGMLCIVPLASWFLAKRTLSPVKKIHEQQKQFVSDASHELRTPLSILSGEMEIILKRDRAADEYQQVIQSSKVEVDRLTGLVENLLFLAREDQSKYQLDFSSIDITDLVSTVIAGFKKRIEEKQLQCIFCPPPESVSILGNEGMLMQLFTNLIENAIKYNRAQGRLEVSFAPKKDTIAVYIKDSGIGIQKDEQKKIFNRFYRVDAARSRTKGYGLGLAISKIIVERHKGRLSVESIPGKYTTFTVELRYS